MADPADNADGASSDKTSVPRHLIERSVTDVALGPICDLMECVRLCTAVGLGAPFHYGSGAKLAHLVGDRSVPLSLLPLRNATGGKASGGPKFAPGDRAGGVGFQSYRTLGIEPCE